MFIYSEIKFIYKTYVSFKAITVMKRILQNFVKKFVLKRVIIGNQRTWKTLFTAWIIFIINYSRSAWSSLVTCNKKLWPFFLFPKLQINSIHSNSLCFYFDFFILYSDTSNPICSILCMFVFSFFIHISKLYMDKQQHHSLLKNILGLIFELFFPYYKLLSFFLKDIT